MRSIQESFSNSKSIKELIEESSVNEGRFGDALKGIANAAGNIFKKVFNVFGKMFAKIGNYVASITDDGAILPVNSPINAGVAYAKGFVNKRNTLVVLPSAEAKEAGLNSKIDQAFKLYGPGNSLQYWRRMVAESIDNQDANVKEGYSKYVQNFIKENTDPINEVKLAADDPEAVYNRVCDEAELKEIIKEHIDPNKQLARLLIWGAPGIGKTAILAQIVNEIKASSNKDYRCIVKTLSNETPDNFTLPKYTDEVEQIGDEDFEALAKKLNKPESKLKKLLRSVGFKATDVPKTWLPVYKPSGDKELDRELDERCGSGLLFIDELSRATSQVLNVILPLINEGNFNGYKLGSGWSIVAASNRMEDELAGQSELGSALSNRFAHVYFEPTVKSWRKWADQQGFMSPLLLNWLSLPGSENIAGGKFYYMDPNEDRDDGNTTQLMCTPRSWTNAMRALACYSHTGSLEGFTIFDIDEKIIKRVLNRYVPKTAIDSFMSFLGVVEKMGHNFDRSIEEIWKTGKSSLKLNSKEVGMVALAIAQLIITSHKDSLPTSEEFKNLCQFLVDANSDQLASCMMDVYKNVFLANLDPELRDKAFVIRRTIELKPQLKPQYDALFSKMGMTTDQFPDWREGRTLLAKKYGEIFTNTKVDGAEALG